MILKFQKKEIHAKNLLEKGQIFARPIEYFKLLEDGKVRGDKNDGLRFIQTWKGKDYPNAYLNITGPQGKMIKLVTGPDGFLSMKDHYKGINLYCVTVHHGLPKENWLHLNRRLLEFGNYAVYFRNSQEFHNRMLKKLKEMDLKFDCGLVRYYDLMNYNGPLSTLHKPNEYSWQEEFRYVIYNTINPGNDLIFDLGSLNDIGSYERFGNLVE